MTQLGKLSLRLTLYGLFVAYLLGDLFVFNGPIRRKIDSNRPDSAEAIAEAKAGGAVARVFHHPINRAQLDRAVHDRLWLDGKRPEDLSETERKLVRYAALGDLIDHQLLRMKVKVNTADVTVTEAEIDDRLKDLSSRFDSEDALEKALESQGLDSLQQMRDRVAARLQQEKYVELRVGPLAVVTGEEAEKWFAENGDHLARSERLEARHIFIPAVDAASDEARQKLEEALTALKEKTKDFPTLAKEISGDPATRESGGSLGWLTRDRLPPDFAVPLFSMPSNEPQLVRTKLGWHLVEITDRKEAEIRQFEEVKPEILASLESAKRHQATDDFRNALRQFEHKHIEIFHDMMAE